MQPCLAVSLGDICCTNATHTPPIGVRDATVAAGLALALRRSGCFRGSQPKEQNVHTEEKNP
jgi:hypothetical protein